MVAADGDGAVDAPDPLAACVDDLTPLEPPRRQPLALLGVRDLVIRDHPGDGRIRSHGWHDGDRRTTCQDDGASGAPLGGCGVDTWERRKLLLPTCVAPRMYMDQRPTPCSFVPYEISLVRADARIQTQRAASFIRADSGHV
jgi:hypothetical protein